MNIHIISAGCQLCVTSTRMTTKLNCNCRHSPAYMRFKRTDTSQDRSHCGMAARTGETDPNKAPWDPPGTGSNPDSREGGWGLFRGMRGIRGRGTPI